MQLSKPLHKSKSKHEELETSSAHEKQTVSKTIEQVVWHSSSVRELAWIVLWCSGVPDAPGNDRISRMVTDSWQTQPLRSGVTVLQASSTHVAHCHLNALYSNFSHSYTPQSELYLPAKAGEWLLSKATAAPQHP